MRIGTNHGSLSDRILNRYGDTPLGMVESALEFARIARDLDYHDFVFSMKASNPKVMIAAYRLLVARLNELGPDWNYPLHLGVTEAGEGEDARIKARSESGRCWRMKLATPSVYRSQKIVLPNSRGESAHREYSQHIQRRTTSNRTSDCHLIHSPISGGRRRRSSAME